MKLPGRFAIAAIALFSVVTAQGGHRAAGSRKPIAGKTVEINLKNKRISSAATTVNDGDTLRLCNFDDLFHKPFSISKPNNFSVTIKPGECKTTPVRNPSNQPIKLAIFDDLHTYERLILTVLPAGAGPAEDADPPNESSNGSDEPWRKALGRWRNEKNTLVLDIVESAKGIEGKVVRPSPVWPRNITPGTTFFQSTKLNGGTVEARIRVFPQGNDCPNLARQPKLESSTMEIDQTGDKITVHQTGRYYSESSCQWSDKTFEETITWFRVK